MVSASGEDRDGNYIENDKILVCVDAVQVEDNLQLLGQNNVPEEWTDAVGTDGNLVNNTLSYIKSGNGIDSVDEIVKTESVKQKLVYATVTYTNKSDEEINHICNSVKSCKTRLQTHCSYQCQLPVYSCDTIPPVFSCIHSESDPYL